VRIHADPGVDEIARSLNARAFTIGSDIVFGQAEHNPASSAGLDLLAHELTHVVQQGFAKPTPEDCREKDKLPAPQTTAPNDRFPAPQMAALKNEPTAGFRTQGHPEVMAIGSSSRQPEAAVIQRQNGGMGSSTEQQCESGFGKNKVGEIYKLYATTPAQPVELTFALIGRRTFSKVGTAPPYPPPDLEKMLRVHLIGEKCGTPMS
jgi:Domain of unknown function (DUF4157)